MRLPINHVAKPSIRTNAEGGALIETAVCLPILLSLFFCFIEVCLAFYSKDMISECAREGTRYAIYHGSTCPTSSSPTCEATATDVNAFVNNLGWPNLGGGTMTVNTTYPDGNEAPGSLVQVSITYVFPIRLPFVPSSALSFSSASKMPILQ